MYETERERRFENREARSRSTLRGQSVDEQVQIQAGAQVCSVEMRSSSSETGVTVAVQWARRRYPRRVAAAEGVRDLCERAAIDVLDLLRIPDLVKGKKRSEDFHALLGLMEREKGR